MGGPRPPIESDSGPPAGATAGPTRPTAPVDAPTLHDAEVRRRATELARRMLGAPAVRVEATLCRGIRFKFLTGPAPQPLYSAGSLAGRRYTPPGGPAGLYLADRQDTALAEVRDVVYHGAQPDPLEEFDPLVLVAVRVRVARVLDLADAATREFLGLTLVDIQAEWADAQQRYEGGRGPMPLTQLLALAAHMTGVFAGIAYPSARVAAGRNLVVFPDRLAGPHGGTLRTIDADGTLGASLP